MRSKNLYSTNRILTGVTILLVLLAFLATIVITPVHAYYGPGYPETEGWTLEHRVSVGPYYPLFKSFAGNGDTLIAAAHNHNYVYESDDKGASWSRTQSTIGGQYTDVAYDGSAYYFCAGYNPCQIYRKAGGSWSLVGEISDSNRNFDMTSYHGTVGIAYYRNYKTYFRTVGESLGTEIRIGDSYNAYPKVEGTPGGNFHVAYIGPYPHRQLMVGHTDGSSLLSTDTVDATAIDSVDGIAWTGSGNEYVLIYNSNKYAYKTGTMWLPPQTCAFANNLKPCYGTGDIYGISTTETNKVGRFNPFDTEFDDVLMVAPSLASFSHVVPYYYNETTYLAGRLGSHTYFKYHQDEINPTYSGISAPTWVNGPFDITFTGVADPNWPVSGQNFVTNDYFVNGVSSIEVKYDGGELGTITPASDSDNNWTIPFPDPDERDYEFYGHLTDSAGRTADGPRKTVRVDKTNPHVGIILDGEKNGDWYKERPTASLAGSDDRSGIDHYEYRLNKYLGSDGTWRTYTGEFLVPEGQWWLEARAFDRAGNKSSLQDEMVFVDTTSPAVSVTKPLTDNVVPDMNNYIFLAGECVDDNIAEGEILLDGQKMA